MRYTSMSSSGTIPGERWRLALHYSYSVKFAESFEGFFFLCFIYLFIFICAQQCNLLETCEVSLVYRTVYLERLLVCNCILYTIQVSLG